MKPSAATWYGHNGASSRWEDIKDSGVWQDSIFYVLAALYALVAAATFIQLVRIQSRVPENGWTTQKVFHLLIFLVLLARSFIFGFHHYVQKLETPVVEYILLDMPTLVYFTTYAILILFWAEIYYQARSLSTDRLKPAFYIINAVFYVIQIGLWLVFWRKSSNLLVILLKIFIAGVSLFVLSGFLLYGGRLFFMLKRFPIEARGRRKKVQEVGFITLICFSSFLLRSVMMCVSAFDKAARLDVWDHPVLIFIHYLLVEVIPTSLIIFILRRLPKKKEVRNSIELSSRVP